MPTKLKTLSYLARTYVRGDTLEAIQIDCLQRIADAAERTATATELTTKRYSSLIDEAARYEGLFREQFARANRSDRTIAALRGVITKLRRR